MDMLISYLAKIAESAGVTDVSISIAILVMLAFLYKYIFKPINEKVKNLPNEDAVKKIINEHSDKIADELNGILKNLEDLENKITTIDEMYNLNDSHMKDLKRDIESIKTILNQFQGHMMYGRRASEFGNQELK